MDVLFGSINVKDLLPTQDSDASSPLSAPDLRLLIDRLNHRSLQIKDKVRDYVHSHRHDFADIFARCSDSVSKTEALCSGLSQALQLLDHDHDHAVDVEIRDLAVEIRGKKRELEERREALAVVGVVCGLVKRLRSVREDLREGRFVRAAEALRGLKEALLICDGDAQGSGGDKGKDPVVFGLLREEWMRCFDELQEFLARILETAVLFDIDHGVLRVNSRPSKENMGSYELQRVLEGLEIVGALDYGYAKLADLMVKHVMKPVISNEFITIDTEVLCQRSEENHEVLLKLVQSSEYQGKKDGTSIYSKLTQIIRFIHKYICCENGTWMFSFGRLTWSRISELVITSFLSKAVPDDASKIAEFQNIIKYTTEFEAFLKEIMFISGTDSNEEKLSLFVHNVEVHFATRKRNEILAKARNLILQCDFIVSPENMPRGVSQVPAGAENYVELLFQQEKCIISSTALQLMDLVHQTLKDVCLSPVRVSLEFYHAARDALLLYKAISPVKLEKQLETISQAAIVLHNDCIFLCQEIFALAFEYRLHFPVGVKEIAVFTDIAPYFRQLAEDILQRQVELANLNLKEAIDGANGYQNTHQMQQYELAKFSLDQVIFILEKMHVLWKPLLPTSMYKRCMCDILDAVFSRLTCDILLLDDIAVDETLQLQRLINMTLENLSSLIESLLTEDSEKEFSSNLLRLDGMLSLCKLRKLADLLDMPLKSITTSWESGELIGFGFTATEVANFVRAIFADSILRKDCLLKIENYSS